MFQSSIYHLQIHVVTVPLNQPKISFLIHQKVVVHKTSFETIFKPSIIKNVLFYYAEVSQLENSTPNILYQVNLQKLEVCSYKHKHPKFFHI
jgi:hypothetical protein